MLMIDYDLHRIGWQACTLYIAEVAPKERRGFMIAMVNNVGATGLVVSHLIHFVFMLLCLHHLPFFIVFITSLFIINFYSLV